MPNEPSEDAIQRIRVDRLPASATEATIRDLFEPYGEVSSFERPTDEQTGASGAYIVFRMGQFDADAAIAALDGQKLDGQALRVTRA